MKARAVVTGVGVVAPAGIGRDAFAKGLTSGRSCVAPISRFDASAFPTRIAATVDLDALDPDTRNLAAIERLALDASREAIADARLDRVPPDRIATIVATGTGTYDHAEVFASCSAGARRDGFDWAAFLSTLRREIRPRAAERRTPGTIPALIARRHGFRGGVMSVMTACAGGTQALGDALRWIRSGDADVVVAGGADSEIYPMALASFCLLGALSRRNDAPDRASRPFDADRDGFVLGEGSAFLVVEEETHALRRGARIYAEVAGFGSASDAYRVTDPHPDGVGAILAMQRAVDDSGLSTSDIDYINAHGTSTRANDAIETGAIRKLFGPDAARLTVSSTKSMIGHLTLAAGAAEAAATILMLRDGVIHPTINYETPDPDCDLDFVPNVARRAQIDVALSNSFAFGGQCATIAVRRHQEPA